MDQVRLENLKKVRAELEVCYEKERQEILANLETELDERKRELLELRNQEMGKLENEHERDLGEEKLAKLNEYELRKQQSERIDALKKELDKEFEDLRNELRMQQREKITKFTEDHDQCLAEILRDFRMDVSARPHLSAILCFYYFHPFITRLLPQVYVEAHWQADRSRTIHDPRISGIPCP
jgi:ribosomal protein L29